MQGEAALSENLTRIAAGLTMRKSLRVLVLLLLAPFLLSACNLDTPSSLTRPGYPGPGYPGPNDLGRSSTNSSSGDIKARFSYSDSGRPVRHQIFYVTNLLPMIGNTANTFMPALDARTAPQGESDESGNVTISSIPPGRYALSLMTPLGPILVKDASKDTDIIFEVTAARVTYLGDINILADSSLLEP